MAKEIEPCGSENDDHFPSRLSNGEANHYAHGNDDSKRRISISQIAIQADIEKKNRKVSNISNRSNTSVKSNTSADTANNGYVNPAFQSCFSGKYHSLNATLHR